MNKMDSIEIGRIKQWKVISSLVAIHCVSVAIVWTSPMVIGQIAESFKVSDGTAGIILSLEFAFRAISGLIMTVFFTRVNIHRLIRVVIIVLFSMHILSIAFSLFHLWAFFLIVRALTGALGGILSASAYGSAAVATQNPGKAYAIMIGAELITGTLCSTAMLAVVNHFGCAGAYIVLASITLIGMPLIFMLPNPDSSCKRTTQITVTNINQIWQLLTNSRIVIRLLSVMAIVAVAEGMAWSFLERVGNDRGFTFDKIVILLVVVQIVSLAGPLIVGIFGSKFGWMSLTVSPLLIMSVCGYICYTTTVFQLYAGSIILYSTMLSIFAPMYYDLISKYDKTGRTNAAVTPIQSFGGAIGPFAGGLILNSGRTYSTFGLILLFLIIFAVFLIYKPARKADECFR